MRNDLEETEQRYFGQPGTQPSEVPHKKHTFLNIFGVLVTAWHTRVARQYTQP